jgi:hypothetical protein
MKTLCEVENEGLLALMGERITLMCGCYFYTGKLVGVNDSCIKLEDAGVVFETGTFSDAEWKNCEKLPNDWYVQLTSIESFGVLK